MACDTDQSSYPQGVMILLLTFWRLRARTLLDPWEVAMFLDRRKSVVTPGPTWGFRYDEFKENDGVLPGACGAKILDSSWRDT